MTQDDEQEIVNGLLDTIRTYLPFTPETARGFAEELPGWEDMPQNIQAAIVKGMLYANRIDLDYITDQLEANGLEWALI